MKRVPAILSLLLSALLLLTGCHGSAVGGDEVSGGEPANMEPTGELVIYRPPYTPDWMSAAIVEFRQVYRDVKVTIEDFSTGEFARNYEEYRDRVTVELMAGEGPDVIFPLYLDMNLSKAMDNRFFLDLKPYMEQDKDFHQEDYLPGIFDGGAVGGGQYIIPLTVQLPIYLSSSQRLEEIGIGEPDSSDTAAFLRQIAGAIPQAEERTAFQQMMSSKNYFAFFLMNANLPLIDYREKTVCTDQEKIRDFFESYKLYYENDYEQSGMLYVDNMGFEALLEGEYYFDSINNFSELLFTAGVLKADGGYTLSILRNMDGKGAVTYNSMVAVRANTKNSMNAWRFIKLLLSETFQSKAESNIPVHQEAIRRIARSWQENYQTDTVTMDLKGYKNAPITEEELMEVLDFSLLADTSTIPDGAMIEIVQEVMSPYFRDEKSYEDCFNELNSRLRLYVDE